MGLKIIGAFVGWAKAKRCPPFCFNRDKWWARFALPTLQLPSCYDVPVFVAMSVMTPSTPNTAATAQTAVQPA
jgi:hypothetical protein